MIRKSPGRPSRPVEVRRSPRQRSGLRSAAVAARSVLHHLRRATGAARSRFRTAVVTPSTLRDACQTAGAARGGPRNRRRTAGATRSAPDDRRSGGPVRGARCPTAEFGLRMPSGQRNGARLPAHHSRAILCASESGYSLRILYRTSIVPWPVWFWTPRTSLPTGITNSIPITASSCSSSLGLMSLKSSMAL